MEETNIETANSQTQNETANETELTVDDYNKLLAEKEELEKKNKQLFARVQKLGKSSDTKEAIVETQPSIDPEKIARLELKVDYGITDPEAIDFVMKNGGAEALKNPYIKTAVDTLINQKKAEQAAVQEESSKSEFERKHKVDDLRKMSSEEMEKILPHA